MAKDYLTSKGVSYEEVNVALDHEGARRMVEKSGQMGVPVIDIDDTVVVGFRPDEFDSLLK
jgi:glutaredoxin